MIITDMCLNVTVILIVIGAVETISKGFARGLEELEIGGRTDTIDTTVLLKLA